MFDITLFYRAAFPNCLRINRCSLVARVIGGFIRT